MKKFYAGVVLNKEDLKDSNSNRIELEYYKISRKNRNNINKKMNVYGIEIIKKEYLGKRRYKERQNVHNLTNDESIIDKLLDLLKTHKVTPIGLNDIIEEVL